MLFFIKKNVIGYNLNKNMYFSTLKETKITGNG
jgi:hypothetical protein